MAGSLRDWLLNNVACKPRHRRCSLQKNRTGGRDFFLHNLIRRIHVGKNRGLSSSRTVFA